MRLQSIFCALALAVGLALTGVGALAQNPHSASAANSGVVQKQDLPQSNRHSDDSPRASAPAPGNQAVPVTTDAAKAMRSTSQPEGAASPVARAAQTTVPARSATAAGASVPAATGAASAPGSSASSGEVESYAKTEDFGIFLLAVAVMAPAALLGIGRWRERKQAKPSRISVSSIIWWGVAFVMAASSVGYALARRDVVGFWDGMVGSWLATLLGIVCGVPVALELERQRRRAEETVKSETAARLRSDVLTMLRGELERVAEQLKQRAESPSGALPLEPLKTSIWDATRASGNLAAIAEPALLQAFGESYRWLGMISAVEANRLELLSGHDRKFQGGILGSDKLEAIVRTYLPEATKWVDYALSFTASMVAGSTNPP